MMYIPGKEIIGTNELSRYGVRHEECEPSVRKHLVSLMVNSLSAEEAETEEMVCLVKDHKGWEFSPETPDPPSRPVVAGNIGINRNISEILSLIIEPITSGLQGDAINSTGDMLHIINGLNESGQLRKNCLESTLNSETNTYPALKENIKSNVGETLGPGETNNKGKKRG